MTLRLVKMCTLAFALGILFQAVPAAAQDEDTTASAATKTKGDRKGGDRKKGEAKPSSPLFKAALSVSDLTDEQKKKLQVLDKSYAKKSKELRPEKGTTVDKEASKDSRAKLRKLNAATRKQIEAILDEAQKTEFTERVKASARTKAGDQKTTGTAK